MAAMGHRSAKLALEVYARKMSRKRDTAQRMEALVWAQTDTNGVGEALDVVEADTRMAESAAL
jgi:hypothetical protein